MSTNVSTSVANLIFRQSFASSMVIVRQFSNPLWSGMSWWCTCIELDQIHTTSLKQTTMGTQKCLSKEGVVLQRLSKKCVTLLRTVYLGVGVEVGHSAQLDYSIFSSQTLVLHHTNVTFGIHSGPINQSRLQSFLMELQGKCNE